MPITISTQKLYRLLEKMPAEQNIMLCGRHGIGKSEILTRFFTERGMKVVALFLGQMSDPGDLIGLPHKDEKSGKTEFMPPYWFPVDGQPIVLFLDELNRARPEVLQTIMDLALNRKLAGRSLPEGSVVISAVNDGEEYQLTDLDPALVSRFNIYNFQPTVAEWLLWAEGHGVDERVTEFIHDHEEWLDGPKERANQYEGLEKSPDRRAWVKVSKLIRGVEELDDDYKIFIAGIVGAPATAAFFASINEMKQISGKDVLKDFAHAKKELEKMKVHQLAVINEDIFRYLQVRDADGLSEETIASNLEAYYAWLEKKGKKEILASFIRLSSDGVYPQGTIFIATKVPGIYQSMMAFITEL
ncbi:MAG: AAA family ATPase [Bacteroidales bacterium]|nr:AAA family ATPase [Bacteroidales bacterium]